MYFFLKHLPLKFKERLQGAIYHAELLSKFEFLENYTETVLQESFVGTCKRNFGPKVELKRSNCLVTSCVGAAV
jgi:hypothetical protein